MLACFLIFCGEFFCIETRSFASWEADTNVACHLFRSKSIIIIRMQAAYSSPKPRVFNRFSRRLLVQSMHSVFQASRGNLHLVCRWVRWPGLGGCEGWIQELGGGFNEPEFVGSRTILLLSLWVHVHRALAIGAKRGLLMSQTDGENEEKSRDSSPVPNAALSR